MAHDAELNQVQSAFPSLHLADVGLGFLDAVGKVRLRQSGGPPFFTQQFCKGLMLSGEQRFLHGDACPEVVPTVDSKTE